MSLLETFHPWTSLLRALRFWMLDNVQLCLLGAPRGPRHAPYFAIAFGAFLCIQVIATVETDALGIIDYIGASSSARRKLAFSLRETAVSGNWYLISESSFETSDQRRALYSMTVQQFSVFIFHLYGAPIFFEERSRGPSYR